ncbi:MAG: Ig-like domain-containing protein [Cytophagaceae bacterium]|nr:Ig-like domain-containing protein [Gemmatimonadaceae bacterium]
MRRRMVLLAGWSALAGLACGGGDESAPVPVVERIDLTPAFARIAGLQQATTVSATVHMSITLPVPLPQVAWVSSDPSVVSVSAPSTASGVPVTLTSVGRGSATVQASAGGRTATLVVTVVAEVHTIALTPAALSFAVSDTASVVGMVAADPGVATGLTWISTTPGVATSGSQTSVSGAPVVITAVAPGTTLLRATSTADVTRSADVFVTVTADHDQVASVRVSLGPVTPLPLGSTAQASAIALNAAGGRIDGRAVTWTSSAPAVATVSNSGVLASLRPGLTAITATVEGRSASAGLEVHTIATGLAAGYEHTCARTASLLVFCWGSNRRGQLGTGSTSLRASVPNRVQHAGPALRAIAAGWYHTCGLSTAATYCWGENEFGQLGTNSRVDASQPVALAQGAPAFVEVALGRNHTCARTTNGTAWCWGEPQVGNFGAGPGPGDALVPTQIQGNAPPFVQVASGQAHRCGRSTTGTAWCWGFNIVGQVGNGTTTNAPFPVQIPGGAPPYAQLTAGAAHTCALTSTGAAWCWGLGNSGQLGNNAASIQLSPVAVQAPGVAFVELAAGAFHTCGRTAAGAIWCWGQNDVGQVGSNNAADALIAVPVQGAPPPFVELVSGGGHSCARTAAGDVWCWGSNGEGQLGNPAVSFSRAPVLVP